MPLVLFCLHCHNGTREKKLWGQKKKHVLKFTLDHIHPVEGGIMVAVNFEEF